MSEGEIEAAQESAWDIGSEQEQFAEQLEDAPKLVTLQSQSVPLYHWKRGAGLKALLAQAGFFASKGTETSDGLTVPYVGNGMEVAVSFDVKWFRVRLNGQVPAGMWEEFTRRIAVIRGK